MNRKHKYSCMGPKCPCIYPDMPHKTFEFVSFKERSPLDRRHIKTKLISIDKNFIIKLKYTARPPLYIQYQLYALFSLIDENNQQQSWQRIQKQFNDYEALIQRIETINIRHLSNSQIENSQIWLNEFEKIKKEGQIDIFAVIVKDVLKKLVQVEEQKHAQLSQSFREGCIKQVNERNNDLGISNLSVTQETLSEQQVTKEDEQTIKVLQSPQFDSATLTIKRKSININTSDAITVGKFESPKKSPLNMSFCRNHEKTYNKNQENRSCSIEQGKNYKDDIQSLKIQLKMITKDINNLIGKQRKNEFIMNRSAQLIETQKNKNEEIEEFLNIRKKTQQDEDYSEQVQLEKAKELLEQTEFRKTLFQKKSPTNSIYEQYLERYTSKYIPKLDRKDEKEQELRSIKSQLSQAIQTKQKFLDQSKIII